MPREPSSAPRLPHPGLSSSPPLLSPLTSLPLPGWQAECGAPGDVRPPPLALCSLRSPRHLHHRERRSFPSLSLPLCSVSLTPTPLPVDVPGETELPVEEALRDSFRVDYYSSYLASVMRAMDQGVRVTGYFAWSLTVSPSSSSLPALSPSPSAAGQLRVGRWLRLSLRPPLRGEPSLRLPFLFSHLCLSVCVSRTTRITSPATPKTHPAGSPTTPRATPRPPPPSPTLPTEPEQRKWEEEGEHNANTVSKSLKDHRPARPLLDEQRESPTSSPATPLLVFSFQFSLPSL
jgi:hypothetical protein